MEPTGTSEPKPVCFAVSPASLSCYSPPPGQRCHSHCHPPDSATLLSHDHRPADHLQLTARVENRRRLIHRPERKQPGYRATGPHHAAGGFSPKLKMNINVTIGTVQDASVVRRCRLFWPLPVTHAPVRGAALCHRAWRYDLLGPGSLSHDSSIQLLHAGVEAKTLLLHTYLGQHLMTREQ